MRVSDQPRHSSFDLSVGFEPEQSTYDRAVGRWHTDADLVTGSHIVDPELVEVLVSRDGGHHGESENLLEHFCNKQERCIKNLATTGSQDFVVRNERMK